MFVTGLEYKKHHRLGWCEYIREGTKSRKQERFVHITNINMDKQNVWKMSYYGRLRWKIENEGFNTQKNQGYNLQHKYAEKDFNAMQNYYQLLQIARIINQLAEKLQKVTEGLKKAGRTIKSIWEDAVALMLKEVLFLDQAKPTGMDKMQLRY